MSPRLLLRLEYLTLVRSNVKRFGGDVGVGSFHSSGTHNSWPTQGRKSAEGCVSRADREPIQSGLRIGQEPKVIIIFICVCVDTKI